MDEGIWMHGMATGKSCTCKFIIGEGVIDVWGEKLKIAKMPLLILDET